jgi:hypothetical protein
MKKTIFTLLFWLVTLSSKSQTPVISISSNFNSYDLVENCYLKDTENKWAPFIGIWQWQEGGKIFTIKFEKISMVYESYTSQYSDYLVGKYKYIDNGITVVNTLNYLITPLNMFSSGSQVPIFTGGYHTNTSIKVSCRDYIKGKGCDADFTLINPGSGTITAQWKMRDREHWNINGQNPLPQGFSIPVNVILTKIP